jgi:hypothetical protein
VDELEDRGLLNTPSVVKAVAALGAKLAALKRLGVIIHTVDSRGRVLRAVLWPWSMVQLVLDAQWSLRWSTMDLTTIKAKIATGVLPKKGDVVIRPARYVSGVCVACDTPLCASDVCVEFVVVSDGGRCLLHTDCYVMWTQACAETWAATALCTVCGGTIRSGTPHYRLGGGRASIHVECRDTIKPRWPRP